MCLPTQNTQNESENYEAIQSQSSVTNTKGESNQSMAHRRHVHSL